MTLLDDLRARVLRDEPCTLEEMRTVLSSIRRGYKSATLQKAPTKSAASGGSPKLRGKTSSMTAADIDKLFE